MSCGFSRPAALKVLQPLGVSREEFCGFLKRLAKEADIPDGINLEQMIAGLVGLWARLGFPDDEEIYWLTHWFSHGFDREKAAQSIGITLKTLNKRIERLTKKIGLTKPPLNKLAS